MERECRIRATCLRCRMRPIDGTSDLIYLKGDGRGEHQKERQKFVPVKLKAGVATHPHILDFGSYQGSGSDRTLIIPLILHFR
jgi:hypothetical protein